MLLMAPPAPALQILVPRVHVQHGKALVPVYCDEARLCVGTIRYGRRTVRLSVGAGDSRMVRLPVTAQARRLRLRLRLKHAASRNVVLPIIRATPGAHCGYAPLARTVASDGDDELFEYERSRYYRSLFVCARGVARYVARDYELGTSGAEIGQTYLGEGWAAALVSTGYRDSSEEQVCMARLRDGRRFGYQTVQFSFGSPYPLTRTFAVARRGAIVIGQRAETGPEIRVVDAAGSRIVDADPTVDPQSLSVSGDTVNWLRGQTSQSATVGPFRADRVDRGGEAGFAICV